ncbi:terminase large subunit domain-containing protein [Mesorhizobium dulcispinae]|uniref:terminase large subunit domain-containing protein n=1 Tax=Mesorhizobium dulcispinae TaxID=3072316 RepID=UPI003D323D2F
MTIDDAGHYSPQQRAEIIAAYPEHEREARAKGIPVLGSGRIFPVPEEMIACEPFKLPRWWPRIGALDFGWDHPSAAVELAWDTEADVVRLATVANIDVDTGGLLVIDGVQTEVGDRILVKDQTDGSENGIRTVSAGQWFRAADARTARTMQYGTTVTVQEGSANGGKTFRFNTLDPVIGDDPISIVEYPLGGTAPAVARDYIDAPVYVADRAALAALDTSRDKVALIWNEGGRNGVFVFDASNQAVNVTNDPQQGVLVAPSSDATGASGAWRRIDLVSSTSAAGAVSPLWFGVTLDGADSTAAFSAFLDFLVYTGIAGELPAGTITLGSKITKNIGSAGLALGGQGEDISILLWTSADGGLNITSTHATGKVQWSRQVELHHFSIKTSRASGGTALSHTISPVSASSTSIMFDYHDLSIQGLDVDADHWDNGIVVTDGWNGTIERCSIKGIAGDNLSPFEMNDAIKLVRCNDCHVSKVHAYHCEVGIHSTSDTSSYGDGLTIEDCRIVGVSTGILSDGSVVNAWMGICNTHINASVKGINLTNLYYTPISENLIYKTHVSTQDNWSGIFMLGPGFNILTGNTISTPGAPAGVTNFGIVLSGVGNNIVDGNLFNNTTGGFYCIYELSGTTKNTIINNIADGTIDAIVGGDGTATQSTVRNNKPITNLTTVTSGDATPSVASLIDNILVTTNTGATSITTFDDGVNQQLLELHVADANTTLVNGATLALLGAQNTSPPNGAILVFRKISTVWTEIGRSYPVGNLIIGSYTKAPQSKLHGYDAANTLRILTRLENDNGASGTAAIGFEVTNSGTETRSAKAGLGLTRNSSNGRGQLGVFVRTTNDGADFDINDLKSGWNVTGIFHSFMGTTVASASTIVPTGNLFHVSGTTNIATIDGTGIVAGTTIRMIFDGILTVTAGSNLKMAGNFTTSASDMLVMTWDGTNWYEEGRSANA